MRAGRQPRVNRVGAVPRSYATASVVTDGAAAAGAANVGVRGPSVGEAHASRAHTASPRPLARTTRTRNETETDFPVGVDRVDYSPQPLIYVFVHTSRVS